MTTSSWFEFEYLMPGWTQWRRRRFTTVVKLGLAEEPDDREIAHETMIVVSNWFRPEVRFRLVQLTVTVFDAPEDEVRNPNEC